MGSTERAETLVAAAGTLLQEARRAVELSIEGIPDTAALHRGLELYDVAARLLADAELELATAP